MNPSCVGAGAVGINFSSAEVEKENGPEILRTVAIKRRRPALECGHNAGSISLARLLRSDQSKYFYSTTNLVTSCNEK